MLKPARKLAFGLAATDHGTLIVNRFDRHQTESNIGYGVGFELLENACYQPAEINMALTILDLRRQCYGTGVMAIDCGANIGVHTVEWAKHMTGWGQVFAIEAQERIYYALGGNIVLNNCFNARAIHGVLTSQPGAMKIPVPNYLVPTSFGSLELKKRTDAEFIGQPIDYSESKMVEVPAVSLDSLNLDRIDLIKIDVEGMELEALAGGVKCIAGHHPILVVEMIKTDKKALQLWLENHGYLALENGANVIAIHYADKCLPIIHDRALLAEKS
jgi:FkbM family methyltransferase